VCLGIFEVLPGSYTMRIGRIKVQEEEEGLGQTGKAHLPLILGPSEPEKKRIWKKAMKTTCRLV